MLTTFITKSIRPLGMFLIFIFATCCIFGSIFVRDIDSSTLLGKFIDYTISFENRFYDFRAKSTLDPHFKSKEIVLVKIDDYSLQKIGMWPIPRTIHAKMMDKLRVLGAKVVALDILYPEKSPDIGQTSPDKALAQSFSEFQSNGGRVFIGYTLATEGADTIEAPVEMLNDAILTRNVPNVDLSPKKIDRYTFPIEELVATEVGLGNISAYEDTDGVFRYNQLVANIDTIYYGGLAFNAYEAFSGVKHTVSVFADGTGELEIDGKKMELTRSGETKIRYLGYEHNFNDISLLDLLEAQDDDPKLKAFFQNKLVFVGSTAMGAHDLRTTPLGVKMPGVYSHMNMTNMLLNRSFFQNTNESVKYSFFFLVTGMILFYFVQRFANPFLDASMIIIILSLSFFADKYYFLPEGYELKLFYCFFCFITCYTWNTFIKFYESNREKKQIRGTFARYVAPTIVDEMLKDPENIQVGGTKMDITCLFSDVRDFTSISEGLTATELAHSLNLYMGEMTDIVFDTKGTLDKYIGDAIVALWGAPLPIGNHAQFAVEGAIKMMEVLPRINEEFRRLGRPEFKVGIGLNSGECSVGNMGSSRIFSYTALGDNMNLGARLESLCKHYGAQILISDFTLERLDLTHIKVRPIDKVIVKGKSIPVGIHEVLHPHHFMSKDIESLQIYLEGYKLFQMKKFTEAKAVFEQVLMGNEDDKPSKRFRDLCQKFIERPELINDQFDVTTMKEK